MDITWSMIWVLYEWTIMQWGRTYMGMWLYGRFTDHQANMTTVLIRWGNGLRATEGLTTWRPWWGVLTFQHRWGCVLLRCRVCPPQRSTGLKGRGVMLQKAKRQWTTVKMSWQGGAEDTGLHTWYRGHPHTAISWQVGAEDRGFHTGLQGATTHSHWLAGWGWGHRTTGGTHTQPLAGRLGLRTQDYRGHPHTAIGWQAGAEDTGLQGAPTHSHWLAGWGWGHRTTGGTHTQPLAGRLGLRTQDYRGHPHTAIGWQAGAEDTGLQGTPTHNHWLAGWGWGHRTTGDTHTQPLAGRVELRTQDYRGHPHTTIGWQGGIEDTGLQGAPTHNHWLAGWGWGHRTTGGTHTQPLAGRVGPRTEGSTHATGGTHTQPLAGRVGPRTEGSTHATGGTHTQPLAGRVGLRTQDYRGHPHTAISWQGGAEDTGLQGAPTYSHWLAGWSWGWGHRTQCMLQEAPTHSH